MSSNMEKVSGFLPEFFFEKEEGQQDDHEAAKEALPDIKLDKHGLPLLPQPSSHEDDPLVSPDVFSNHFPDSVLTCIILRIGHRC